MLILFFLHLARSKFCPIYQCSPFPLNETSGQCIEKEGFTYNLGTCSEKYYSYCPPNQSDSYCQLPLTPSDINISYVGEQCIYDRNCLDSLCHKQRCSGKESGDLCNSTSQCDVGLYCNQTCVPQKGVGEPCSSDQECKNSLGCFNSNCTKYFSVPSMSQLESCSNGINYLCETGACGFYNNSWLCLPSLTSRNALPQICGNDGDCIVKQNDAFSSYSTDCECGFNPIGVSFCKLAPGDKPFKSFMKYMKTWLTSKSSNCHSLTRDSLKCISEFSNTEFFAYLQYYYLQVMMFPSVQMNDDCIKEVFTGQYWDAVELVDNLPESDESDSYSFLLNFSLFLFSAFNW